MKRTLILNSILGLQVLALSSGLCNSAAAQAPTADQQKSNKTDRELTQKIRQAVVGDKSLSSSAHNVKIISRNGSVTLRGTVNSEEEKKTVEQKAVEVAGAANVTNDLTVRSK